MLDNNIGSSVQQDMAKKALISNTEIISRTGNTENKSYFTFLDQSETKTVDYQSDFYNLANCIHQLLYFENLSMVQGLDGVQMPRTKLKRYWNQDLWTDTFTVLLNPSVSQGDGSRTRCNTVLSSRATEIEALLTRVEREFTSQLNSRKFNVSFTTFLLVVVN